VIGKMAESNVEKKVELDSLIAHRREFGRKVFLQIHKTIGLFAGAIVVLVGLSGSILAFREDIDEWLNASIMRVEIPAQPAHRPLDEILAAAVAAMPSDGKFERLTMPRHSGAAVAITYMVETDDLDSYFYEIFVDPYTAKVKGQRLYLHGDKTLSQPLIPIVMAFHWTLLLGVNNAYLLGAAAIHFDPRGPLSLVAAQRRLAAGFEGQMGRESREDRLRRAQERRSLLCHPFIGHAVHRSRNDL